MSDVESQSARETLKQLGRLVDAINSDRVNAVGDFFLFLQRILKDIDQYKLRQVANGLIEEVEQNIGPVGARLRREREADIRSRLEVSADKAFWERQTSTMLSVGNGTGVVGIGAFLANSHPLSVAAHLVWFPFISFLVGVMFSAATPIAQGRTAHFRLRHLDAKLGNDSDHYRGRAAADKDNAEITWSGIQAGCSYLALMGLGCGICGIIHVVINQA